MILVKILSPVQLPGVYSDSKAGAVAGCYITGDICGLPTLIANKMITAGVAEAWDAGDGAGTIVTPSPAAPQDIQQFWNNN